MSRRNSRDSTPVARPGKESGLSGSGLFHLVRAYGVDSVLKECERALRAYAAIAPKKYSRSARFVRGAIFCLEVRSKNPNNT